IVYSPSLVGKIAPPRRCEERLVRARPNLWRKVAEREVAPCRRSALTCSRAHGDDSQSLPRQTCCPSHSLPSIPLVTCYPSREPSRIPMTQPSAARPDRFRDVEHLEEVMTTPSAALGAALETLPGDIIVLGVGGKIGPTLARLAKRAAPGKRVVGVARFSDKGLREQLAARG